MSKIPTLKNKRILVTAGSTWVPIDSVRVITNIFGGALGVEIATLAQKLGASVTLLLGPGRVLPPKECKTFKTINYKYYDELLELVTSQLASTKYDIMIHSAAVADYTPENVFKGKIKSTKEKLVIRLKKTKKIVDLVKKISPEIFLVKFKLEVGVTESELISIAKASMKQSDADMIVANDFNNIGANHKAYIIDKQNNIVESKTKEGIAKDLLKILSTNINYA